MTKPTCCSSCLTNDSTGFYCGNPYCYCHQFPSSLQNLIREREAAFEKLFITDDGDYAYVGNDLDATTTPDFLRESIRLAFLAGMREARSCVPEEKQYELMQDGVSNDFGHVEGWKKCRAATLAAIEKKSREVGEGSV